MSIMDLFKPKEPEQQTAPAAKPDPAEGDKMAGTEQTPANPVDAYKNLYDTTNIKDEVAPPPFKLDSAALADLSSKMDFTKGLAPELVQKATSGDANAMIQLIQAVGQNAYRASVDHTTALTDTYLGTRQAYDTKQVQNGVRQQLTQQELSAAPNYDNPVVKAELNRIAAQYAKTHPESTPQEVAKATQQYIIELSKALSPEKPAPQAGEPGGEMDWSKYLSR